jgi:glycosidase
MSSRAFLEGRYHTSVIPVLWNLIDSHDTSRFLHRAGGDVRMLRLAAALQMLLPGTPFIYYGDEVGMTGGEDPDNRRGMLWDEDRQDLDIYKWYQKLTFFRHILPDLPAGRYKYSKADDSRNIIEICLMSGEIIMFNCVGKETSAREYLDYNELLTGTDFKGILEPYGCVLLRKKG